MRLIASMLTHNEMGRFLPAVVDHLLGFCDEVRIVDDGSTDGTFEHLADIGHPVEVVQLPQSRFFEHEGRTRQALLEWTLQGEPTYVIALDADEFVSDGAAVRKACESGADVYSLTMLEAWKASQDCLCIRGDGAWPPHPVHALWRVSDAWQGRLRIADRALACGRVPEIVDQTGALPSGASLYHFGWTKQAERAARHHRYQVADGGRYHQSQHLDSILWPDQQVAMAGFDWPPALDHYRDRILKVCNPKEN